MTPESAIRFSRLHPRCGTTFLLFVMSIAILLHTVLVPLLLLVWTPDSAVAKHLFTIAFKLLLMVPISALSYELIRYAARLGDGFWGRILRAPGMFLQLLTTREPELDQVEVAVAALASAVGQHPPRLETPLPATGVIDVCQTRSSNANSWISNRNSPIPPFSTIRIDTAS